MFQTLLGYEGNNHLHAGFLGLLRVGHLNQMDGQCCHLAQKEADNYETALSHTHVSYPLSLQFNFELEANMLQALHKEFTNLACNFMRDGLNQLILFLGH